VKGDDPSLSVYRRKVSGQGRPRGRLCRDAYRTKIVPLAPSRWDISLVIYRWIYMAVAYAAINGQQCCQPPRWILPFIGTFQATDASTWARGNNFAIFAYMCGGERWY
jgi:hypothetical protein